MHWRCISLAQHDVFTNLAIDEALLESVIHTKQPILRFHTWQPGVSIGYFQSLKDIDKEYCKKNNIPITRRLTGGGALLHSSAEIAYTLIAPKSVLNIEKDVRKTYSTICQAIIDALAKLVIDAKIENTNDIFIGTKKVSASAQVQREGVVLQQGNILFGSFDPKIFHVVKEFKTMQRDELQKLVQEHVTSVSEHLSINQKEFYHLLKKHFSKNKEVQESSLTTAEQKRVAVLKKKYASVEWLSGSGKEKSRGACYFGHVKKQ